MPAREPQAAREADAEVATEAAPEVEKEAQQKLSAEGDLPAVAKDAAAPAATASEQAFDGKAPTGAGQLPTEGMYHPDDYKELCEQAGKPEKWDPKYHAGHTSATQFTQPYQGRNSMEWTLKRGQSASEAVKDFLKGPTLADYTVISVAEDMDELRDDLGDQKFDMLFGSHDETQDSQIPGAHRLKISTSMYTIPFVDQMMKIADDHDAKANVVEPTPTPVIETRGEEKPKHAGAPEQDPVMVAKELGVEEAKQEVV